MTTSLGATGPRVFLVALGCMGLSGVYGATSDDASVAFIGDAETPGVRKHLGSDLVLGF